MYRSIEENNQTEPEYLSEEEKSESYYQYPHTFIKNLSYFLAFGAEVGNIANGYYGFLLTFNVLTELIVEINDDNSISKGAKTACYIFAAHLAGHRWANDTLGIIPAENFQVIYEKLVSLLFTQYSCRDKSFNWSSVLKNIFKLLLNALFFTTFAILSADGTAGYMLIFYLPILVKTLGLALASIGTLLGISYSHFYYTDIIFNSIELFKNFLFNPVKSLKRIVTSPCASLQVFKSYFIVSGYYSTIGGLYLLSVVNILKEAFAFQIKADDVIFLIKYSSASVFLTNFFIRFLPFSKKYFNDKYLLITDEHRRQIRLPAKFYIDVLIELFISAGGVIFSLNYFTNYHWGLAISCGSFGIGLAALYRQHLNQTVVDKDLANPVHQLFIPEVNRQSVCCNHRYIAAWTNFWSRIQKSYVLLFAGFWRIQATLKEYAQLDFKFSLLDYGCLVIIFGTYIGANKTAIDIEKLETHIELLKTKWQMGRFGAFGCLFRSHKAYPPNEQNRLRQILKIEDESIPLLTL